MPWGDDRPPFTATFRRVPVSPLSTGQHSGWCSTRCGNVWILGKKFENAFIDVRIFNPSAQSEKRREYDQRVCEIEHATFTPLVLSTTGGMGRAAITFYRRFASMLAEIRDTPYSTALIRCRLSFALLRASIMSISGARSSRHHTATEGPIDLQLAKAISTNSK